MSLPAWVRPKALYRSPTPDEVAARAAVLDRVVGVSTTEPPVSTMQLPRDPGKSRKGDRHRDPKAHSAKTAARAKAKRAKAAR